MAQPISKAPPPTVWDAAVLKQLFSFLDPRDVALCCRVCKQWDKAKQSYLFYLNTENISLVKAVLNGEKPDRIVFCRSNAYNRVFFLKDLPHLIFKIRMKLGHAMQDRFKNYLTCKRLCKQDGHNRLVIPETRIFTLIIGKQSTTVLVEQWMKIDAGAKIDEWRPVLEQLGKLINDMDLNDIVYRNFPALDNSRIALLDLEDRLGKQFGFASMLEYVPIGIEQIVIEIAKKYLNRFDMEDLAGSVQGVVLRKKEEWQLTQDLESHYLKVPLSQLDLLYKSDLDLGDALLNAVGQAILRKIKFGLCKRNPQIDLRSQRTIAIQTTLSPLNCGDETIKKVGDLLMKRGLIFKLERMTAAYYNAYV